MNQKRRKNYCAKIKKDQLSNTKIILFFRYVITYAIEFFYTFVLSLFPFWCDEFEQQNPIVNPIQINQTELNNLQPNNIIIENSDEQEDIIANNIKLNEENSNFNNSEGKVNSIKKGEKVLIKSSNDTRLVNPSETHDNKYCLVEENENRTENEFVFSENVNIDTLSYNEPIIESLRKKHTDSTEKEVELNK